MDHQLLCQRGGEVAMDALLLQVLPVRKRKAVTVSPRRGQAPSLRLGPYQSFFLKKFEARGPGPWPRAGPAAPQACGHRGTARRAAVAAAAAAQV